MAIDKLRLKQKLEQLEKMAGFRNILIHEYSEIDTERVYQAVHKDIDDLIKFAQSIHQKYFPAK